MWIPTETSNDGHRPQVTSDENVKEVVEIGASWIRPPGWPREHQGRYHGHIQYGEVDGNCNDLNGG